MSPYFDAAYFDPAYFDAGAAAETFSGGYYRRQPQPVRRAVIDTEHEDLWLLGLMSTQDFTEDRP